MNAPLLVNYLSHKNIQKIVNTMKVSVFIKITHLVYSSASCSIKHLSSFHQGNGTSRRLLIYHSPNYSAVVMVTY